MVNKKIWDVSGITGQNIRVTALGLPPAVGVLRESDADTITMVDEKGQVLTVVKESITSIASLIPKVK
jgi:hypothetical protein